jgi:glycosyltransferase involved in cell wall biosynthesis
MITDWFQWSLAEWILASSFIWAFIIQLFYYLYYYRGIVRQFKRICTGKAGLVTEQPPVSIIIRARDQEECLAKHLPIILEQDYPQFQVVVVNDASTDETENMLILLEKKYPHLYHTFVPPGVQSVSAKKMAMTIGIKAAKYDYLLFTEANCTPNGPRWIASMMRHFDAKAEVVLSFSAYAGPKSLLRKLISYDNLFQAIRYLGMAVSRKPYMGVGRNMAYRKELFFSHRGFASHLNLNSGEDDLFISDVATASNARVDVSPESKVLVESLDMKENWRDQKISQIYTAACYKGGARFRTGMELCTRFAFYSLFVALLILGLVNGTLLLVILAGVLFLARYIVQLIVINGCAKSLDERRFYLSIPWFDLILPCYSMILRMDKIFHKEKSYTRQILH